MQCPQPILQSINHDTHSPIGESLDTKTKWMDKISPLPTPFFYQNAMSQPILQSINHDNHSPIGESLDTKTKWMDKISPLPTPFFIKNAMSQPILQSINHDTHSPIGESLDTKTKWMDKISPLPTPFFIKMQCRNQSSNQSTMTLIPQLESHLTPKQRGWIRYLLSPPPFLSKCNVSTNPPINQP